MTANRLLNIAMVTICLVTVVLVSVMLVRADDGHGATGEEGGTGQYVVCTDPPSTSVSASGAELYINVWWTNVSHPGHTVGYSVRASKQSSGASGASESDVISKTFWAGEVGAAGARRVDVSSAGRYKVTLQVVAERGGDICESATTSTTATVTAPPPPTEEPTPEPTDPPPTEEPTPEPTDPPPTEEPTPDPTEEATPVPTPDPTQPPPLKTVKAPRTVSVATGRTTATISWSSVTGAAKYKASWSGGSEETTGTSVIASGLTCGTSYTFSVKAKGKGSGAYDSEWGPPKTKTKSTSDCPEPEPPPADTPTPEPTATNTPVPQAPSPPARPSSITYKAHSGVGGDQLEKIRLVISWPSAGSNIVYEVQQKLLRWGPIPDTWETISNTRNTQVVIHAEPDKDYRHRVRSTRGSNLKSSWLAKSYHTPLYFIGHQADHTVQYRMGTPSPTRSSYDPPGYYPDSAMPTAIAMGIKAWNVSPAASSDPRIQLCTRGPYDCRGRKDDGRTVTVNIRPGGTCGSQGYACIIQRYSQIADSNGHVNNLEMVFEEPSRLYTPASSNRLTGELINPPLVTRLYWTNERSLHMDEFKLKNYPKNPNDPDGTVYHHIHAYLPRTVMHEFGHALGLHDLYRFNGYDNYVMGDNSKGRAFQSIPEPDLDYIEEVYESHAPHTLQ